MSTMKHSNFIIAFLLLNQLASAQFDLFTAPLRVECKYVKEDSTIKVNYKNITKSEIALWVGDFDIKYISGDKSYSYIALPIRNNIFFYNKRVEKNKFLNYYDSNDTTKYLYKPNYKILIPNEIFTVAIKSTSFSSDIKTQKLKALIRYSIIDIGNLCIYLKNNKLNVLGYKHACFFEEDKSFNSSSILNIITDIKIDNDILTKKQNKSNSDLPVKVNERISPNLKSLVKKEGESLAPFYNLILNFHSAYISEVSIKK